MAWNPNKPQLSDLIADSIADIRGNFQALDSSRIVEMGSNSNGTYVRWENGLQMCWHENATASPTSNHPDTNNPTRASDAVTFVFPAAYVSLPRVSPAQRDAQSTHTWPGNAFDVSGTECKIRAYGLNSAQRATIGYIAIGRWK